MSSAPLIPVQDRWYGSVSVLAHDSDESRDSTENTPTKGDCMTFVQPQPQSNFARNKLLVAAAICLAFTLAEALGGYLSNSLAIFTDASHMATDFISYFISLSALWIAKRPSTKHMSFGWYRAEVLGAVMSVFTIWIITGILVYLAIGRLLRQDYELEADPMLITAGLGVLVNITMILVLKTSSKQDAPENINVQAAFIHVIGDLIQSIGVLIGAVIIKIKPDWKIADPICTFVFAIMVLFTTIGILSKATRVLMEGVPKGIDKDLIEQELGEIPGVMEVHSLHIWSLTTDRNILSVHITIDQISESNYAEIMGCARDCILSSASFHHITIQLEQQEPFERLYRAAVQQYRARLAAGPGD